MKRTLMITAVVCALGLGFGLPGSAVQDPGPTEDRVGFPEGYQTKFKALYVFDRPDNRNQRVIYGNEQAASAEPGQPFPYGSIIVMETWRIQTDANNNPVLDALGRFQPTTLNAIFVARKERGFGEAYQHVRNGEWEYVAYRPDKTYQTMPQNSGACARCHLQAGVGKDWQFRMSLYFAKAGGDLPASTMQHYRFLPGDIAVKSGERVTWYNDDEIEHRIVLDNYPAFDSGNMKQGASYSLIFSGPPAEYNYHCSIHPKMRGKVVVK